MPEISRATAEKLTLSNDVVNRSSYSLANALWLYLLLENGQMLVTSYDYKTREKTYFVVGRASATTDDFNELEVVNNQLNLSTVL